MKDPDLWQRLTEHGFPLDDQGKTLLSHLANETTLGADKAAIALQEYRKFLYLTAVAGEIVAPSPLIDRIWHTHIEHTRAYFDDFCPRIIGRVIHNAPGPESAAINMPYESTLALYLQQFGVKPSFRIWPRLGAARRFNLTMRVLSLAVPTTATLVVAVRFVGFESGAWTLGLSGAALATACLWGLTILLGRIFIEPWTFSLRKNRLD